MENTTYEDWYNITTPRIKGAWNLHELLPENLDFFVLLSSFISGSGNIGQSIYSATAVSLETMNMMKSFSRSNAN